MQVTVSPEVEQLIEGEIRAGRFATATEVVAAAVIGMAGASEDPTSEALGDEEFDASLAPDDIEAIDRAQAEYDRGEWTDLETAKRMLRARLNPAWDCDRITPCR